MKTNSILLIMLVTFNSISQANFIRSAMISVAIPTTIYLYQADGNTEKALRLVRQDTDNACNAIIKRLETNCTSDIFCKELIKKFEQTRSTPSQIIIDTFQESIEATKKSEAYKSTEKATTESYNALKKTFDDVINPKK
ncbi:hypothetical protein KBC04_03750 [Candidatus Babeliales bacterium]|nr:hypothetical protein [Candidatus Babeliales bacterium]MBP9844182.1 hypothetical protein [Candidatus Babeliales bacterium]